MYSVPEMQPRSIRVGAAVLVWPDELEISIGEKEDGMGSACAALRALVPEVNAKVAETAKSVGWFRDANHHVVELERAHVSGRAAQRLELSGRERMLSPEETTEKLRRSIPEERAAA